MIIQTQNKNIPLGSQAVLTIDEEISEKAVWSSGSSQLSEGRQIQGQVY